MNKVIKAEIEYESGRKIIKKMDLAEYREWDEKAGRDGNNVAGVRRIKDK